MAEPEQDRARAIKPPRPCVFQSIAPPPGVYDRLITVDVGPDEGPRKQFNVYRGLLCHHSGYFNTLLNGPFMEGGSNHVRLKDTDVGVFEAFFYWLNRGRLFQPNGETIPFNLFEIAEIYIFGDAYIIPRVKNAALDLYLAKSYELSTWLPDVVAYIYDNTTDSCQMRKMLVDEMVAHDGWKDIEHHRTAYHKDFLIDVLVKVRDEGFRPNGPRIKGVARYNLIKRRLCTYHDHSEPNTIGGSS